MHTISKETHGSSPLRRQSDIEFTTFECLGGFRKSLGSDFNITDLIMGTTHVAEFVIDTHNLVSTGAAMIGTPTLALEDGRSRSRVVLL